jgi:Arm DNA-binding domain
MGTYPDTPLKAARDRRDRARALLEEGVDPSEARRAEKANRSEVVVNGFEAVARMAHDDPSWPSQRWVDANVCEFENHVDRPNA